MSGARTILVASAVAGAATVARRLRAAPGGERGVSGDLAETVARPIVGAFAMAVGLELLADIGAEKAATGIAVIAAFTAVSLAAEDLQFLASSALN